MRALLRKLRADLRSHRLQRLLLLVLLSGAATTLALSLAIRDRGESAWGRLFDRTDGAHVWLYGQPGVDLSKLVMDARVSATTQVYPLSRLGLVHPDPRTGSNATLPLWLVAFPREQAAVGRAYVTNGRWFGEAAGEVVLERRLAENLHLRVGDRIALRSAGGDFPATVVGLGIFPGRSPFSAPSLAWASEPTVQAAGSLDAGGTRTVMGIRLHHRDESSRFTRDALASHPAGSVFLAEDWKSVRITNDDALRVVVLFLGVFSVFALLASATVIVNAIGGRVLAGFRDIGVMKAIGFTPGQVVAGFMLEHVAIGLVAAVAGIAIGTLAAPMLDGDSAKAFEIDSSPVLSGTTVLGTGIPVAVAVTIATLLPAWRASRISTARAVTRGAGQVASGRSMPARAARRMRLPLVAALGLKDVYARPLRAWLTVAALAMTALTAVFVLVSEATIHELSTNPAALGEPFDAFVNAGAMPPATMERTLASTPGIGRSFQREEWDAGVGGGTGNVNAVVVAGDYRGGWIITRGRMFNAPGEALAGKGFLDEARASVGDEVPVVFRGKSITVRIVGQYRDLNDNGKTVMFGLETVREQADPAATPRQWAITLAPGARMPDVVQALGGAGIAPQQIAVLDHDPEGVGAVHAVLAALAGLLLAVGLAGLLNSASLGVRERRHDLAVLKCIGLTPGQAMGGVLVGGAFMAGLGALIGIPAGLLATRVILDVMSSNLGWGPGIAEDPPLVLLLGLAPALVAASVVAVMLPALAASRTPVSEALRAE